MSSGEGMESKALTLMFSMSRVVMFGRFVWGAKMQKALPFVALHLVLHKVWILPRWRSFWGLPGGAARKLATWSRV
jgi:hypothetical protein